MDYPHTLLRGKLQRRYKRFLADVELDDGQLVTVHCPNTGAMTGCAEPGSTVWLSRSHNPRRKYAHTWELVETARGLACIHSALANKVVGEALNERKIPELSGYSTVLSEVRVDEGKSRLDFSLSNGPDNCLMEVKCVTLSDGSNGGAFPDAVSARAQRHLQTLEALRKGGSRAVLFFCVFHSGIKWVQPASAIDPAYAMALARAVDAGVEVLAYGCDINPRHLELAAKLPFHIAGWPGGADVE